MDVDEVLGTASQLSCAADSGPSGVLPYGHGCGSSAAESLLLEDAQSFARAWREATKATMQLATDASGAVDAYRRVDESVTAAAESASEAATSALATADRVGPHG